MRDCISSACLHETNKNSTTITSIKKASQRDAFFIIRNYVPTLMNAETEKTTHSSSSTRSQVASCTGNFETLGSKFSNETATAGCLRPSYNRLVLSKKSINIIVRSHVLAPIRSGTLQVCPHDYKYEHRNSHVALELS